MAFTIIAGPCVIEQSGSWLSDQARRVKEIFDEIMPRGTNLVFKASWDKANRSSLDSFRGIGLQAALNALYGVKDKLGISTTTDIHLPHQARTFGLAVDVLQIPAFLARQTDLIVAAAGFGRQVSIKIPPWADVGEVAAIRQKCVDASIPEAPAPWMIYRGTSSPLYGTTFSGPVFYSLVKAAPSPLFLDITHSNGGDTQLSIALVRDYTPACQGLFMEVHPDPKNAYCDAKHQLDYTQFRTILSIIRDVLSQNASPV